jgi:pyruvate kinase
MLSGETANGAYPVEAVQMMDKIACTVERSFEFREHLENIRSECFSEDHNPGENLGIMMSRSGVDVASNVGAKAIVTPTLGGNTARLLSVFRPDQPVIAVTSKYKTIRELQLYWGVQSYYAPIADETESMIQNSMRIASETGTVTISDKIVLVAGLPLQSPNMVNTVRVIILGTILARSSYGGYANPDITRVRGKIIYSSNPLEARDKMALLDHEILACRVLTRDFIPIIRIVKGIICEEISELSDEDLKKINPDIVWLTHIRHPTEKIESGLTVTIDAKELLVYEGTI